MKKQPTNETEQYADQKFNSSSLRNAAKTTGHHSFDEVNALTQDEEHAEGASMFTHQQIQQTYFSGTIDQDK